MPITSQLGTDNSQLGNIQLAGANFAADLDRTISDVLTLTDLLEGASRTGIASDTITLVDTITQNTSFSYTLSDTLTFLDYFVDPIKDELIFDDEMIGVPAKIGDFSDVLAMTEDLLQSTARGRLFGDLLEFAELWKRNFSMLKDYSDVVSFSDALTGIAVKVFGESMTFTDSITYVLSKLFKDSLEFGDSMTNNHVTNRAFTDQVVLFDSLALSIYTNQHFDDTLTLNDSLIGFATRPLYDTVVYTDTITGVASTPLFDTVSFTENLTFTRVINKTLSDSVIFSDDTSMAKIISLALNDAITLIELWQAIRARFGTLSDTLNLTDEQLRAVIPRTIEDELVFEDEILYEKTGVRTMNDTLPLDDQFTVKTVLTRQTNDSVLFLDAYVVKVLRGSIIPPPSSYPPIRPVTPPDGTVNPPEPVLEGVIEVLPQLIMTGRTRSIVLPPPEFNDFEANQGKIVVQRTMTGRFRVYARRTQREKLNWRFVLPKYKADELREFMLAEIDTVLNVITWDGDYWNLQILSDTADFVETGRWAPGGNKTEVTIELVGNRYA